MEVWLFVRNFEFLLQGAPLLGLQANVVDRKGYFRVGAAQGERSADVRVLRVCAVDHSVLWHGHVLVFNVIDTLSVCDVFNIRSTELALILGVVRVPLLEDGGPGVLYDGVGQPLVLRDSEQLASGSVGRQVPLLPVAFRGEHGDGIFGVRSGDVQDYVVYLGVTDKFGVLLRCRTDHAQLL